MPTEPNRPSRWWIAPLLGLVVVVTAVGALVAHNLYQRPTVTPPQTLPAPASTSSSQPAVIGAEPGSPTVQVTADVQNSPLVGKVRDALQKYFNAINVKPVNSQQYLAWRSVVAANLASKESEQKFEDGYKTTRDGTIMVYRVDIAPDDSLRVLLSFHSTQELDSAPSDFQHTCIEWHVVWPLSSEDGGVSLKVDSGMSGATPQRQVC